VLTKLGASFEQFSVGLDLSTLPQQVEFVARSRELTEMHQMLHGHRTRSTVVLHGLGGIGKTQLSLTYATRHEEKFSAIFWLNANDEDSLRLSYLAVAHQILKYHPSTNLLTDVDLDNLENVVYAVKSWLDLQKNTSWLMIYDNYDNPQTVGNADSSAVDIRRFLPGSNHGSIIITTRSAQVKQGQRLHIQKLLDVQEGLKILSNTSGRKDIKNSMSAPEMQDQGDTNNVDPDALALVKELDGLPLALTTAGAYLEHVTTSFSDYLRLYNASWLKLQTSSPQLTSYEDRSLYTTWQITFDRIEQQNPASAKLLKLWAYFDRQDLWFELLRHANSADDLWIQKLTADELEFNEAVTLLCSFGLVDPDRYLQQQFGHGGYSVHSCVHSWMMHVLNKDWDECFARLALNCVASMIPSTDEKDWWLLQRRLLQHAARQDVFLRNDKVDINGLDWAFQNLGGLYYGQGKLVKAEKMYIRALQGCEEALGPDHISTLNTVHNLGNLYKTQGKLAEAEKMYIRALQSKEEALGPDHISTLNTVNNLGSLYVDQGKLAEAEKMYIRALQGKEEVLGPDHISTLDTVHNLGSLYKTQGKLAEAEKMYIRALQGYEEALGPDHISTLNTVHNLGNLYKTQGKLAEAEKMYIRALQGKEEALGPDHISTLNTVNNLGSLYADQGKLAEAEKMYIRALHGYEDALGIELVASYLPALNTMVSFGNLLSQTDRKKMAKVMYTRALSGYTAVQGHSSMCTLIEGLLHDLQLVQAETETHHTPTTTGTAGRKPRLQRLLRRLRT
jgi:tetratricopeptide (TPR) repeat protein